MWTVKISSLFAFCVLLYADGVSSANINSAAKPSPLQLNIITSPSLDDHEVQVGEEFSMICNSNMRGPIWWMKDNQNITLPEASKASITYTVKQAEVQHSGSYICVAKTENGISMNSSTFDVKVLASALISGEKEVRVRSGSSASLTCDLQGHPLSELRWEKIGEPNKTETLKSLTGVTHLNENHVELVLRFERITPKDNGTYECRAKGYDGNIAGERSLVVTDQPEVKILTVKPVSVGKVYLNWTVNDHNDKVTRYLIEYQMTNSTGWEPQLEEIDVGNFSFVTSGLEAGKSYRFRITATNSLGSRIDTFKDFITLPIEEPEFIPTVRVVEKTNTSMRIDIAPQPKDLKDYDFYYNVTVTHGVNLTRYSYSDVNARAVIIEDLEPGTEYKIRVAACNYYTKKCGGWSAWISDDSMGSFSSGLYPAGLNLVVGNTVFMYFAVKHLFT